MYHSPAGDVRGYRPNEVPPHAYPDGGHYGYPPPHAHAHAHVHAHAHPPPHAAPPPHAYPPAPGGPVTAHGMAPPPVPVPYDPYRAGIPQRTGSSHGRQQPQYYGSNSGRPATHPAGYPGTPDRAPHHSLPPPGYLPEHGQHPAYPPPPHAHAHAHAHSHTHAHPHSHSHSPVPGPGAVPPGQPPRHGYDPRAGVPTPTSHASTPPPQAHAGVPWPQDRRRGERGDRDGRDAAAAAASYSPYPAPPSRDGRPPSQHAAQVPGPIQTQAPGQGHAQHHSRSHSRGHGHSHSHSHSSSAGVGPPPLASPSTRTHMSPNLEPPRSAGSSHSHHSHHSHHSNSVHYQPQPSPVHSDASGPTPASAVSAASAASAASALQGGRPASASFPASSAPRREVGSPVTLPPIKFGREESESAPVSASASTSTDTSVNTSASASASAGAGHSHSAANGNGNGLKEDSATGPGTAGTSPASTPGGRTNRMGLGHLMD